MADTAECRPEPIWCGWDERYYTRPQLVSIFSRYLAVMIQFEWDIEVPTLDDITEENIGHVVYHADLYKEEAHE